MKFCCNGKLVRTSKNHVYTHAVINIETGSVIVCRASKESAESFIATEINTCERGIANARAGLKAFKAGKSYYYIKYGRKNWREFICNTDTEKTFTDWMERFEERKKNVIANWRVVKLEAKA